MVTCARGTSGVLAEELREIGAPILEEKNGAVLVEASLEHAYRTLLYSRIASRALWVLDSANVASATDLYEAAAAIPFSDHFGPEQTLAVDCVGRHSAFVDRGYAARKVKDAIVDRMRARHGRRPSVDPDSPDVRVHLFLEEGRATFSLDLSGGGLHRRGYRPSAMAAPLRENLAAALLRLASWPARAKEGLPLVDPMCGSGTLLVEAACMAGDVAPGLGRGRHGFERWFGHDERLWQRLVEEARARREAGRTRIPRIVGFDAALASIEGAQESIRRADMREHIEVSQVRFADLDLARAKLEDAPPGIVVMNPPYGERLGESMELVPLYERIGDVLRRRFPGWTSYVLTGSAPLAKRIGLKPAKRHVVWNGAIECRFLEYPIAATPVQSSEGPGWRKPSAEAAMFENRLRKNLARLGKWAARENLEAYRLYDADIPEYNVAVDVYGGAVHVQEYEPPRSVDPRRAERRLTDVLLVLPDVLGISPDEVHLKVRRRQRGGAQYGRVADEKHMRVVREGDHRFLVNLSDYLDTGLFLGERRVRSLLAELAPGRRFLNLFAHTCSASVYAAKGGAIASASVDLSNTYLAWGLSNFDLNGVDPKRHSRIRTDCLSFVRQTRERYGLIYLAPPTYSRSKGMEGDFDVVRDAVALVSDTAALLEKTGVLVFTTHAKGLVLGPDSVPGLRIEEISRKTASPDFERSPHRAFRITLC